MPGSALLISDLHLTPAMPRTAERFFEFLEHEARTHEALIILGDLFEYWVGDDAKAHSFFHNDVAKRIKAVADSGVTIYFMPGNRDFLLGPLFAKQAGMNLLPDPYVMEINGQSWVLTHGDALCTADKAYQRFRHAVRQTWLQRLFLKLPVWVRLRVASSLRKNSTAQYQRNLRYRPQDTNTKTDVTLDATARLIKETGCRFLIHGHTHRQNFHTEQLGDLNWKRWVLSDWDFDHPETVLPKGNALSITHEGMAILDLVRN